MAITALRSSTRPSAAQKLPARAKPSVSPAASRVVDGQHRRQRRLRLAEPFQPFQQQFGDRQGQQQPGRVDQPEPGGRRQVANLRQAQAGQQVRFP
jgi:hypothetical protein